MNVTFKIEALSGYEKINNRENVIATVEWSAIFEAEGGVSTAAGKTILNTANLDNFSPIQEVTEQQIIDWVIAEQGGEHFVNTLKDIHQPYCEQDAANKLMININTNFTTRAAEPVTLIRLEPIK